MQPIYFFTLNTTKISRAKIKKKYLKLFVLLSKYFLLVSSNFNEILRWLKICKSLLILKKI